VRVIHVQYAFKNHVHLARVIMKRVFLIILPGTSEIKPRQPTWQRMDSLARSIQQAIWLSHGLRQDTSFHAYFVKDGMLLTLQPHLLTGMHIDERSVLGQLAVARQRHVPGIAYTQLPLHTLRSILPEYAFILDEHGRAFSSSLIPSVARTVAFILGGPEGIPQQAEACLEGIPRVSLGRTAYLASSVIAYLTILLDREKPLPG